MWTMAELVLVRRNVSVEGVICVNQEDLNQIVKVNILRYQKLYFFFLQFLVTVCKLLMISFINIFFHLNCKCIFRIMLTISMIPLRWFIF